jgi:hypothetical protein
VVAEWELRTGRNDDPVSGLASLPDRSVDVFITDPPYEAEAHTAGRRLRGQTVNGVREVVTRPLDFPPITLAEREAVSSEMARLARRWVVVFCQAEGAPLWRVSMERAGLQYIRQGIWVKPDAQPQLTGDRPGVGYETMVIAHPPGRKRWNGGGRVAVWEFTRARGDSPGAPGGRGGKAPHPTTKPLGLMSELVELFSEPGELVCDPYAGSGTTGVACRMLGRRFLGWEQDAHMAEIARRRIAGDRAVPIDGQMEMF